MGKNTAPLYAAKVKETGKDVKVWKHATSGTYCDYMEPTISYKPDEIVLGDIIQEKED